MRSFPEATVRYLGKRFHDVAPFGDVKGFLAHIVKVDGAEIRKRCEAED
jgi:hypothetical protein